MTTYPPTPTPPEPKRPDEPDEDGAGGEPGGPRPFSGNPPGPTPPGATPGETPQSPADEPTVPSDEGWPPNWPEPPMDTGPGEPMMDAGPGEPPPMDAGPGEPPPMVGGYGPYAGGAVPPPPPSSPPPSFPPASSPPPTYSDGRQSDRQTRNGLGTAALVCGVIAAVVSMVPVVNWFTWPLGVLAIVFGAVGWSRANKGEATNKNAAVAGVVLGIVSFFTFCLVYVIIGAGAGAVYYDIPPMR